MKILATVLIGFLAVPMVAAAEAEKPKTPAFSLAAGQAPEPVAERYLFDLVERARQAKGRGYLMMGLGAGMAAGGAILLAGIEDDEDVMKGLFEAFGAISLLAGGTACVVSGVGYLVAASGAAKRYAVVQAISDPVERDLASRDALASLARSGKVKRLVFAGLFSALAISALITEPQSALVPTSLAAYQFLRKSRAEKTYAAYLASGGLPPETIVLGFGPGPRGGLRLVLTASF